MVDRLVYGRAWNHKRLVMGGQISEEEARRRYEHGSKDEWFGVAAYSDAVPEGCVPEYTLEVLPRAEFISVSFYDQVCRLALVFSFRRQGDGRMFRTEITQYTYSNDNVYQTRNKALVVENYSYLTDGTLHWSKDDSTRDVIEKASYRDIDVSDHWEPVPAFGDWASIARYDRES